MGVEGASELFGARLTMTLLSTQQLAAKWKVSEQRVRQWAARGRIVPVFVSPTGQPFYDPTTKKPRPISKGGRPKAS